MHTIDPKGRVSLPAEYRTELQRRSDLAPFLAELPNHLALYPHEDWLAIENRLVEGDPFSPELQDLKRLMVSGANTCTPDAQGRILIPPLLRESAHLERDVVIAGVLDHVEIWDRARWNEVRSRTETNFREISSKVSSRGNGI